MIHGWLAMKEKAALEKVAAQLDFEFVLYDLKTIDDLESAIAAGLRDDVSGFYISMEPMMIANLTRVITSIAASRSPA
jgi:putative ABC transport system substrate-binding protein